MNVVEVILLSCKLWHDVCWQWYDDDQSILWQCLWQYCRVIGGVAIRGVAYLRGSLSPVLSFCLSPRYHYCNQHLKEMIKVSDHCFVVLHSLVILNWFCLFLALFQQTVFQITPLSAAEWFAVLKFSLPVILLDEVLKTISRSFSKCKNT